jgi:protein Mpv17
MPDALAIPGASIPIWGAYLRLLARRPQSTKMVTSSIIFAIAQTIEQSINNGKFGVHNWRKMRDWCIWGFAVPFINHRYQNFLAKNGPKNLFAMIALDHAIYRVPINFVLPMYIKLMEGMPFKEAWQKTLAVQPGMQKLCLAFWPLVQILNFSVVPLELRVLYQNFFLFWWGLFLCFLYGQRAAKPAAKKDEEALKDK